MSAKWYQIGFWTLLGAYVAAILATPTLFVGDVFATSLIGAGIGGGVAFIRSRKRQQEHAE